MPKRNLKLKGRHEEDRCGEFELFSNSNYIGSFAYSKGPILNQYCLWSVFIKPNYRNRGIGTIMLKRGIRVLKNMGAEIITLGVFTSNKKAIKFYKKIGFIIYNVLKGEIIMRLNI